MDRRELESLDRETLVARAQAAGIRRARILTRPELVDELLRLDPSVDAVELAKSRGFFGRARDLVARAVERGLHLPDAAERIRAMGVAAPSLLPINVEPRAIPTVTLAEIYAAQGHRIRATDTLRRLLAIEPEHASARALLARLEDVTFAVPVPVLPPEPEIDVLSLDLAPSLIEGDDDERVLSAEDRPACPDAFDSEPMAPDADGSNLVEMYSAIDAGSPDVLELPDGSWADGAARVEQPDPADGVASGVNTHVSSEDLVAEPPLPVPDATDAVPETRDVADWCIAIPLGRENAASPTATCQYYVAWHIDATRVAAMTERRKPARLVARALVVSPSWDGPQTEIRDLDLDDHRGEVVVDNIATTAVVRVAVGWLADGRFYPLAQSPAIEGEATRELHWWTPGGSVSVSELMSGQPWIAAAVEGARRRSNRGYESTSRG